MLIQIHILQNYAPANLNRDDTGAPKDTIFGGTRRGRISSQCLKRSMRRSAAFVDAFEAEGLLGMRTKSLPTLLGKELEVLEATPEEISAILAVVPKFGRESGKEGAVEDEATGDKVAEEASHEDETKQLIFIGPNELRPLAAKLLTRHRTEGAKKWAALKVPEITKALGPSLPQSVDIAMFGRMTTSDAFRDVQAAVQVAHAISTNALTQEFDYYTAVDDLSGESGAGMIGDVEFNSSTYYKYLNVHWEQLVENLGGDRDVACRGVLALLAAAAMAQPSGKQNSFAAFNLPDLVLVEVQPKNLPVSYANAFLKPARPFGDRTLVDVSAQQFGDYMARLTTAYGVAGNRAYMAVGDQVLPAAEKVSSLAGLQDWLAAHLPE